MFTIGEGGMMAGPLAGVTVTTTLYVSIAETVGTSSRYVCGTEKLAVPFANWAGLIVMLLDAPSPHWIVTTCCWATLLIVPERVTVAPSLIVTVDWPLMSTVTDDESSFLMTCCVFARTMESISASPTTIWIPE